MKTKDKKLMLYSLDQLKDELIGETGTPARDEFEKKLLLDIIRTRIREAGRQRNSSREQSE